MNGKWFAAAIVMTGATAACGQGRLIFNVDVFSFLKGSVNDTVPYVVPPLTSNFTISNPAQKINLVPGLSGSLIDTVKVTGTADVLNQAGGPGTLRFQVYLAGDSAGTYGAGRDSLFSPAPSASISAGASTQSLPPFGVANLSPKGNALFSKSEVWIRLAATVSNTGAAIMRGKAVLTGLDLRIVVQDKVF
jgi:hypothetical protein